MAELDAELVNGLKMAKGGKEMFFAFIPKGPEGKLIVSRKKIPPKEIAEIKKEIGGGNPVIGKCSGPFDGMVFKVPKMSATLGAAIKKVAKRDAGFPIVPEIVLAKDADLEEEDLSAADKATADKAGNQSKQAPGSASAAAGAGAAAPEAATAAEPNLAPWQAARQKAIDELKALAKKIASTKHASAAEVLKELNAIIAKLPAEPKPQDIDKLEVFIRDDDTITAAEESPDHFHKLRIRGPLLDALLSIYS